VTWKARPSPQSCGVTRRRANNNGAALIVAQEEQERVVGLEVHNGDGHGCRQHFRPHDRHGRSFGAPLVVLEVSGVHDLTDALGRRPAANLSSPPGRWRWAVAEDHRPPRVVLKLGGESLDSSCMALVTTCTLALVLGSAIQAIVLTHKRRHPRPPSDPAKDRRKTMPWLIAIAVSALLLLPVLFSVHGPANAVFAGMVLTWFALTLAVRLVGYLAGRMGRFLVRLR
jgi:hypothetical protein